MSFFTLWRKNIVTSAYDYSASRSHMAGIASHTISRCNLRLTSSSKYVLLSKSQLHYLSGHFTIGLVRLHVT